MSIAAAALEAMFSTVPANLERVRRLLSGSADGDRQMLKALGQHVHSTDVIPQHSRSDRDPVPPMTILAPERLRLQHEPLADCARYHRLRRAG